MFCLWMVKLKNLFGKQGFTVFKRKGLLFGYYGDGDSNLAETHDHVNLAWVYGWGSSVDTLANAMEHIREAGSYNIRTIVLGVESVYLFDGENWLRQYLQALSSKGLLQDVKALYPIDEPDTGDTPKTDAEVILTNQMVRRVAAEFPELANVKLAVIYGDRGFPGIGSYDWVGFDNYGQMEAIFCDGSYQSLKDALRSDQRILLVPGGASPWEQDPAPFYNKAVEDTQVIALIPFIWQDNAAPGVGAGIRSNGTKPRYIQAGTWIKSA